MDSMREKDELSQKRPNRSKWSSCMHHSIPKHTRVIWSLSNFETMIEVALQTNSNLPSIAQSYGQQLPSHIGNNASHTGATIQACAWERNPVLCIICTKLFEAIIVGTIDIAVYDIHVVWAVCSRCTSSSQVPQPLLLVVGQLGNLTTQRAVSTQRMFSRTCCGCRVPHSYLPSHSNYKPKVFDCWAAAQTWEREQM